MLVILFFAAIFALILAEELVRRAPKKKGVSGAVRWKVKRGTLYLTGSGPMENYSTGSRAPWGTKIKAVCFGEGITKIGEYAFANCRNLRTVTVPAHITAVGSYAFAYCSSLEEIVIECAKDKFSVAHGAFPEGVSVTYTRVH